MRLPLAAATLAVVVSVLAVAPSGQAVADPTGRAAYAAETTLQPVARRVTQRLRALVRRLPVRAERRAGYDRDRFRHWVDADGDGCDTRDEVLLAEAVRRPRVLPGCELQGGRWRSYYDGRRTGDPSTFDVDHLVPLAEAWDSGARRWSDATRERYANDLGDPRTLVAVTASANRSKGDQDPAEWLPRRAVCRYVGEYVAVKTRWRLAVDRREKRALRRTARGCRNVVVRVRTAPVRLGGGAGGGGGGGAATDPRFGSCSEATAHGYGPYVRGRDPEYSWYRDGDGDGVVCE